ncbi:hypothetical protein ACH419_31360 [Streptomyces bobili]|uniref:hypothetical protein n=1 Tax=Streptomyces bobili TaxID=67280 RepID=UPI0037B22695
MQRPGLHMTVCVALVASGRVGGAFQIAYGDGTQHAQGGPHRSYRCYGYGYGYGYGCC